ncbi:MBOAT family O-acyltransferase [Maribacter sp. CXY002]|uniref:MBOAT family O-acyltransferase n=1 Tax=Maribacter luteocoastalis TaxID=3407671 RepID=UPI003B67DF07
MLFNSIEFVVFLLLVFPTYWFLFQKNLKLQNLLIVIASYVFYGWWDYRFLALIIFSTVLDFLIGVLLTNDIKEKKKKFLLWTSLLVNLGFLGVFKYYNFFMENLIAAFAGLGITLHETSLQIILPVGISFYTFQTLSYTIDVYKRKLEPTKDLIAFAAFVSFFPQLVAGPIERASNLLPQFYKKRIFNYQHAVDGMRQILWGLFKKIVIADNCAVFANEVFGNHEHMSGSSLLLGAIFFTFQIYGDFSGYSDIAIGTSRLFGFDLKQNFAFPYFSRDIAEFWRRWHISLSTWFRDYLYIPLGGSRGGTWMKIRNTFIIFLVSGFWHGANWTFIVWGGLNALYFLPIMLSNNNRKNLDVVAQGKLAPNIRETMQITLTFSLTVFAWIFFRSASVKQAITYIKGIFDNTLFQVPTFDLSRFYALQVIVLILIFIIIEWFGRDNKYAIEKIGFTWGKYYRRGFYFFLVFVITLYLGSDQTFIYFQF